MKTSRFTLIVSVALLAGACKKESDSVGPDACNRASERANAVTAAAQTYAGSPTRANCEAYRRAANDFLDAAGRCTTVTQAQINDARNAVNALNCQ